MDLVDYYYTKDTSRAVATPTPNNGNFKLYSIAYPMLAKTVSVGGPQSPTGLFTNRIGIGFGVNFFVVNFAEGFPSVTGLVSSINASLSTFPLLADVRLVQFNNNQVAWENKSATTWTLDYVNRETRCLITGDPDGPISTTIPTTSSPPQLSAAFTPDPTLGLNSLEFRIANGERISLPATGEYLDNVLFYLNTPTDLLFSNSNNCSLIANYASLRITKELMCPKTALIRLAIENFNK